MGTKLVTYLLIRILYATFFYLVTARYKKKITILTFTKWAEVFGDYFITSAILDRLRLMAFHTA